MSILRCVSPLGTTSEEPKRERESRDASGMGGRRETQLGEMAGKGGEEKGGEERGGADCRGITWK